MNVVLRNCLRLFRALDKYHSNSFYSNECVIFPNIAKIFNVRVIDKFRKRCSVKRSFVLIYKN